MESILLIPNLSFDRYKQDVEFDFKNARCGYVTDIWREKGDDFKKFSIGGIKVGINARYPGPDFHVTQPGPQC